MKPPRPCRYLAPVLALLPGALASGADQAGVAFVQVAGAPATRPGPLDWLKGPDRDAPTLSQIVGALSNVAADDSVRGVVVRLKDAELSQAMVEEIGAAMRLARDSGKKVHLFAEQFGAAELLLGSYADEVIAQAGGAVSLPGVYMEEMFLADTLDWLGIKANFVQVGDYKGASEQLARNSPSPEWSANIDQLLDGLYANMRAKLADGRHLTGAQLDQALAEGWLATTDDAQRLGLIDAAIDLPDLSDHLAGGYSAPVDWRYDVLPESGRPALDLGNPFAFLQLITRRPDHTPTGPTLAVLHIQGVIVDGDSQEGGLFGGGGSVGSRTIRNAIQDILSHDEIRGVVVRIDSPGGSATASEVMWQGLRRLSEKKPVWVSVGAMAASGGYYCAVGGDKVYVNPSSIVGSIGVVGGRLGMAGLYDKLKVRVHARARGPMAGIFRSTTDWTDQELATVRAKMTQTYELFTTRVTAGRPGIDLAQTAEGRLFVGEKAVTLKMADAVGGLDQALADLAAHVGLDSYDVLEYPAPKSLEESLEEMFGQFAGAPSIHARELPLVAPLRQLVGQRHWEGVADALEGILLLRESPVVLVAPSTLIVR